MTGKTTITPDALNAVKQRAMEAEKERDALKKEVEELKSKKITEVVAERDALKKQLEAVQPKLKELVETKKALELHLNAEKADFQCLFL